MNRSTRGALLLAAALFTLSGVSIHAQEAEVSLPAQTPDRVAAFVELGGEPAALAYARSRSRFLSPLTRAQADSRAVSAARARIQANEAAQNLIENTLGRRFRAQTLFRVSKALNGIAVRVDRSSLEAIRSLPDVKAVRILPLEYPTNSTSVPFLGLTQIWGNTLSLPQAYTGTGVRIGVIDTGIDYQHANFGGTGLLADYQANNRTVAAPYFPTSKVVGGWDFAGDSYTGSNAAAPDEDPMDCNRHGTHVAGTAAGLGVNADGTTFAGPHDGSVPFGSLRIGPGTAPGADLYALRVFGCSGGTNLTVQAIDWAIDPNDDGDFSDRLDVINMSLGSDNGSPNDTSAAAAENAAFAGVIVVASAGNAGDTFFVNGSPGVAKRAISVAASSDDGNPSARLTVNSPAGIAGHYVASATNSFLPTPAPAPSGQTATLVLAADPSDGAGPLTTDGCSPLTNAGAIAGNIALIDRGTCGFQVKAANAQNAGAIGVIIANNVPGDSSLISMGGTAGTTITIPALMISQDSRNVIVPQLPANVTLSFVNAGDSLASFSSRGPMGGGSFSFLKPDLTAPGLNITSAQTGITGLSTYNAGNNALTISGTSMAAPHVAGIMALLRQQHPDWNVEELKALAMNTSFSDITVGGGGSGPKFGPGRIGAGRVRPADAAQSRVIAYNAEDAGLVSVSFDGEVAGIVNRTKKLRIVNKGASPATFDLAVVTMVDAPGVSFSLPGGSSVAVPANGEVVIDVQMSADSSLMDHAREASVVPVQAAPTTPASFPGTFGNASRHWLTEEAAYVTLSESSVLKARVPVYVNARPASTMTGVGPIVTGGAPTGSTTIPLAGGDVCTGTLSAGPTCVGTLPNDEVSLVTPFELQVSSPRDPLLPGRADLRYAGVALHTGGLYSFGVSTWEPWSSPTDVAFNVYVDFNEDGTWDRIIYNSNLGTISSRLFGSTASPQDTFINSVLTPPGTVSFGGAAAFVNRVTAATADTRLFNNNVLFLSATAAQLGLTAGDTTFRYKIVTCPGFAPLCLQLNGFKYDEAAGPFFFNSAAQGLDFGGTNLAFDLNGAALPVTWNTANMATNGSLGALLLHHHNVAGTADQVVLLDTSSSAADLSITRADSGPTAVPGTNRVFTTTVTNNGPATVTNATVIETFPSATGLNWICTGLGGGSCPATGLGAINALVTIPPGDSVVFTSYGDIAPGATGNLATSSTVIAPFSITDSNLSNNTATDVNVLTPTADLMVTKTDGVSWVNAGQALTYTIVVTNAGPSSVSGAPLVDTLPPNLTGATWTCVASAGSSCAAASGAGNINKALTLLPLGTATFTVSATVGSAPGPLVNTATIGVPPNTSDPNTSDNSATDTDQGPLVLATLAHGVIGTPYAQSAAATGGVGPYTYSVSFGSLPTGLTLTPSGAGAGNIAGTPSAVGTFTFDITATDTGTPGLSEARTYSVTIGSVVAPGSLVIREFRSRGPAGVHDEFVEVVNKTAAPLTLAATDGSAGFGVAGQNVGACPTGSTQLLAAIPNGTVIPAGGFYLVANTTPATGYSLAGYGGALASLADAAWTADLCDNSGIGLFRSASLFDATTRIDAAGFVGSTAPFIEGAGIPVPASTGTAEVTYLRNAPLYGAIQDTGVNANDFFLGDTGAGAFGAVTARLASPGPQNAASEKAAGLTFTLADPTKGATVFPNRWRTTSSPTTGTYYFRWKVTNNTGAPITKLRIRVANLTTLNSPGYLVGGSQADFRFIASSDVGISVPGAVTALGLTPESPTTPGLDGGYHASAFVTLPGGTLANGASVYINVAMRYAQAGAYAYFVSGEAK